jgi:hypothetical protein
MRRFIVIFATFAGVIFAGEAMASGTPYVPPSGGSATSSTVPADEVNTCTLRGDSVIVVDASTAADAEAEAVTWFLSCHESPTAVDIYELELGPEDVDVVLQLLELLGYEPEFRVN